LVRFEREPNNGQVLGNIFRPVHGRHRGSSIPHTGRH
jgi:hypothetical protein